MSGWRRAPAGPWARIPVAAGALLLGLSACSPGAAGPARPSPDVQLSRALASADSLHFEAAVRSLEALRARCGPTRLGRRATLLLAAVHLDPRNPSARPDRSADLAGAYLGGGGGPAWTRPLAEALYLEALERGGAPAPPGGREASPPPESGAGQHAASEPGSTPAGRETDAAIPDGCRGSAGDLTMAATSPLPSLPGSPLYSRMEELRRRVAELEAELRRIRKTLEP